jgi:hypothetical protein
MVINVMQSGRSGSVYFPRKENSQRSSMTYKRESSIHGIEVMFQRLD